MKKILLIEDNKDMRENTAEILALANYEVFTAKNGKEGVELAQKQSPDLIICDIMMPLLDGYGVLHMLSKSPATASIPFIFLTAKADRGDFRKGMEMGADDYVTKPFDDIELLNAIESRLKKAESLKQEYARNMEGLDAFISTARGLEELKKLSEHRTIRTYRKREGIYLEGSLPRGIYFVNKGKVKTFKTHELGKELITGLYKEGDFFGYVPLMEDVNYNDSAETLEESEICFIPKDDFTNLIYRNAAVSQIFIRMLSNELAAREEQLLQLAYTSVRKRVAGALVTLCNRYKKDSDTVFAMQLSREDLANLAGTATETTIRTLSDFKEEGYVDIKGGMISVLDYDKLQRMRN